MVRCYMSTVVQWEDGTERGIKMGRGGGVSDWVRLGIDKRGLDQVKDVYVSKEGEQVFHAESMGFLQDV